MPHTLKPPAAVWFSEHAEATRAIAWFYGRDLPTQLHEPDFAGKDDSNRNLLAAAAAYLSLTPSDAEAPIGSLAIALEIERLTDPLVKDALYLHYWRGMSAEAIAEAESLKPLLIKQNLRRGGRSLGMEPVGWRGPFSPLPCEPKALFRAVLQPRMSLPDSIQAAVVDCLAAAARQAVADVTIVVGQRSARPLRGRPWIDTPERKPTGLSARETPAQYGSKTFAVSGDGWSVNLAPSPDGLNLFLLGGNGALALDGEGNRLGALRPDAPTLSLPGITLPAEITFRSLGQMD